MTGVQTCALPILVRKHLLQHRVSTQNSRVSLGSSVKPLKGRGIAALDGANGKGICRNVEMMKSRGTINSSCSSCLRVELVECRET